MTPSELEEALGRAVTAHQAGRLAEAESLYRQVLSADSAQPDALHLLGVLALQARKGDVAVQLIRQALAVRPDWPEACNNLGNALKSLGRWAEAESFFRQALALRPAYAEGHLNLGNALQAKGQIEDAIASYQQALAVRPEYAEAFINLGSAWQRQRQWDAAAGAYRKAVALKSDSAEAFNNLGTVLRATEHLDEAIAAFERAISLRPQYTEAWMNLGHVRRHQGQWEKAEKAYRKILERRTESAEAHNHLGAVLLALGRQDEAVAHIQRALQLQEDYPEAHLNLGHAFNAAGLARLAIASYERAAKLGSPLQVLLGYATALHQARQFQDAIAAFERALALRPDYPEAWVNYGNTLRDSGLWEQAKAAYERAIALRNDYAEAHGNLGNLLKDAGRIAEALTEFRAAQQSNPKLSAGYDSYILTLHYYTEATPQMNLTEVRRWEEKLGAPLRETWRPHGNDRSPDRRLRIGYVSSDFMEHACGLFSESLLTHHDHEQFEIFCYAQVPRPDAITGRFEALAEHWLFVHELTDEALAQRIRDDQIDILLDLNVHTGGNRLEVFARKPAPLQVTWLGYPGTSGLAAMDYRLTDPFLDPPGVGDNDYTEQSIRLPDTFWCYSPREEGLVVNELPALRNGYVTFGSLNNYAKFNEGLFKVWAEILRAVPDSKLMLLGRARQEAMEVFSREGVARDRIIFVPLRPRRHYLELYHEVDFALDPFPCNGHTTSFDSLWMGVPFVSWPGRTVVGRAGLLQLSQVGFKELVVASAPEYVDRACQWAADLPRLAELRAGLRGRMERSPLMDGPRFARNMEAVYREIWRKWCAQNAGQ